MKTINLIIVFLLSLLATSCSSDETQPLATDETAGLSLVTELSNANHTVQLHTRTGSLQQGYNAISIRIKDNATGKYEENASLSWTPLMQMMTMQHSCPRSAINKAPATQTMYSGYIVFQMAQNDMEHWQLAINYTINGQAYAVSGEVNVPPSARQRVASFVGSDGNRYVVALVSPEIPQVGTNAMNVAVFKMQDMMTFPVADNLTLIPDPRMPGMGNHGSPVNSSLVQEATGGFYQGTVSLTMTGYWKISLIMKNASGEIIKGEAVTDTTPASSLYLEMEF